MAKKRCVLVSYLSLPLQATFRPLPSLGYLFPRPLRTSFANPHLGHSSSPLLFTLPPAASALSTANRAPRPSSATRPRSPTARPPALSISRPWASFLATVIARSVARAPLLDRPSWPALSHPGRGISPRRGGLAWAVEPLPTPSPPRASWEVCLGTSVVEEGEGESEGRGMEIRGTRSVSLRAAKAARRYGREAGGGDRLTRR